MLLLLLYTAYVLWPLFYSPTIRPGSAARLRQSQGAHSRPLSANTTANPYPTNTDITRTSATNLPQHSTSQPAPPNVNSGVLNIGTSLSATSAKSLRKSVPTRPVTGRQAKKVKRRVSSSDDDDDDDDDDDTSGSSTN